MGLRPKSFDCGKQYHIQSVGTLHAAGHSRPRRMCDFTCGTLVASLTSPRDLPLLLFSFFPSFYNHSMVRGSWQCHRANCNPHELEKNARRTHGETAWSASHPQGHRKHSCLLLMSEMSIEETHTSTKALSRARGLHAQLCILQNGPEERLPFREPLVDIRERHQMRLLHSFVGPLAYCQNFLAFWA